MLRTAALVGFLCLLPGTARCGVNVWTSNGPDGGKVQALAIDPQAPSTLYAGASGGGVFKSTDGGANWSSANNGLTHTVVNALAIDPQTPSNLYVVANNGGVFKSTDGGANWSPVNNGLAGGGILSLAIDPQIPTTLYAGAVPGVFKSTDGGANWSPVNNGLSAGLVLSLEIDPQTSSTLYAATLGGGVFKSTDGGANWSSANNGLTVDGVRALRVDPLMPTTLYAGTQGAGVFKSMDGGASWTSANNGLTSTVVNALGVDPQMPSTLYAATLGGGVFKSADGGANWSPVNNGITDSIVLSLAIDPQTPSTLHAGMETGGVFKSMDGGANWSPVNRGLAATAVTALEIDPQTPSTFYTGTYGSGVFKSADGGANWVAINNRLTASIVSAIAIDPQTSSTLYAGTRSGVFKSTDGGAIWDPAGFALSSVNALAIDPQTPTALYAGTNGGGVFKSTDGGTNWSAVNDGLTDRTVYALAIDPQTPSTLYAGTFTGVFKSTDGGAHWSAVNNGLTENTGFALAIDPQTPTTLYDGTGLAGVFKSTDGGAHWSAAGTGLPHTEITSLRIDPQTPTTLYAGAFGAGVFELKQAVDLEVALSESIDPVIAGSGATNLVYQVTVTNRGLLDASGVVISEDLTLPAGVSVDSVTPSGATTFLTTTAPDGSWTVGNLAAGASESLTVALTAGADAEIGTDVIVNTAAVTALNETDGDSTNDSATVATSIEPECTTDTVLCLNDHRFEVEVFWKNFQGDTGAGQVVESGTADSGLFWFFNSNNWEVMVKVLDGCKITDHFWVFAAATTNVEYTLRVTDTATGTIKEYFNPLGSSAAAITDTEAFATCGAAAVTPPHKTRTRPDTLKNQGSNGGALPKGAATRLPVNPVSLTSDCDASSSQMCLNRERFLVEVFWQDVKGNEGVGQVVEFGTADSGLFWFFASNNWEMMVKVLDGCKITHHYWVFAAATTNVRYTLRVTDTATGEFKEYFNPLGTSAPAITDTTAFATCP